MSAPWFDAFAERVAAGEPVYRQCTACEATGLPPRNTCPNCGEPDMADAPLTATGTITSFTEIQVTTPRFTGETPYTVVLVEFDEGIRLTGQLRDGDEVARGDRVHLGAEERDDGWLVTFTPTERS